MNLALTPSPVSVASTVFNAKRDGKLPVRHSGGVNTKSEILMLTSSGALPSKAPSMAVLSETFRPHATAAKAATAARMNDLRLIFMNINVQPFLPRSGTAKASRFSAINVKL